MQHFSLERTIKELRMKDKASTQISAGSDKAWSAWAWPHWAGRRGCTQATLPSSGREHQDTQWDGYLGRLRQDRTEVSLAQTLLGAINKDRIM